MDSVQLTSFKIRFFCVFVPVFSSPWLGLTIFFSQVAYFFQYVLSTRELEIGMMVANLLGRLALMTHSWSPVLSTVS